MGLIFGIIKFGEFGRQLEEFSDEELEGIDESSVMNKFIIIASTTSLLPVHISYFKLTTLGIMALNILKAMQRPKLFLHDKNRSRAPFNIMPIK